MKTVKLLIVSITVIALHTKTSAQKAKTQFLNFTNSPEMPAKILWPAVISNGAEIFAINGFDANSGYSSNIYRYNTQTGRWNIFNNKLGYKIQPEAAYLSSTNNAYVFGGYMFGGQDIYKDVQKIDMETGDVTILNVTNPTASAYGCALAYEGNIYLFGGTESGNMPNPKHTLSYTYKFDPSTLKFTRLANMPEALETNGALVNGVIYTFGGYNQFLKYTSRSISAYDIKTNKWQIIGKLPEAVSANSVAVYGNIILVVGSYDTENFLGYFDTITKTFTRLRSNFQGRRDCSAVVIGDKLYVFGGTSRYARHEDGFQLMQVADLRQLDKTFTADFK